MDVFVDTNVFVYARDATEPAKQAVAIECLRELWIEQRGRTSVQVLNEYYVTVTRKLRPGMDPDDAWDDVDALRAWRPCAIDMDLLVRARGVERRYGLSWWDAMVVAAAQMQSCGMLLSEDLHDGLVCETVVVRNPFAGRVGEESGIYAPEPVSRHKRPGRPRRERPERASRVRR